MSSTFCMLQGIFVVQTAYAVSAPLPLSFRTFTYARTVAHASIVLGVQRRETRAADKLRTDRQAHTTVL